MTDLHSFVIEGGTDGRTTKVMLDGVELQGVTDLRLIVNPGDVNRLELEFVPGSVKVNTRGVIEVRGIE